MLINRLYIQRFRGIRDLIELDLSYPLTIIYAPNGTGKTSICDAVEWTLSGNVKRIHVNSPNEIECRFGTNSTFVEIELLKEIDRVSQIITFKRELQRAGNKYTSIISKKNNGLYKKISDLDLLGEFVPEIATSKKNDQANWMYSTRFLEGESLSLLIDGDEDALGARMLIFSNLFGIKQYQETEKQLLSILNKLPADSTIKKDRTKLKNRLEELNRKISDISEYESSRHYESASLFLDVIAEKLSLQSVIERHSNVKDKYKALEVEFVGYKEKFENKKQTLILVRNNLYRFLEQVKKTEILEEELRKRNSTLFLLKAEFVSKSKEYGATSIQFDSAAKDLNNLEIFKSELKDSQQQYNEQWLLYQPLIANSINEQAGYETVFSLQEASKDKISELISKQNLLKECSKSLEDWFISYNKLNTLNLDIETLKTLISKNNYESIDERLSVVRNRLLELQQERESTLGELDLLLSSGQKYVEAHIESTECPLCEYDFKTNEKLLSRINARYFNLSQQSKAEAQLFNEQQQLVLQSEQSVLLIKKIASMSAKKDELILEASLAEAKFKGIGIVSPFSQNKESLVSNIENKLRETQKSLREAEEKYETYSAGLIAREKIIEIMTGLSKHITIFEKIEEFSTLSFPNFIDEYKTFFNSCTSELDRALDRHKTLSSSLNDSMHEFEGILSELKSRKEKEEALISQVQKLYSKTLAEIDQLKEKWSLVSSGEAISEEAVAKASKHLEAQSSLHNEIAGYFSKAQEYIEKGFSVEKSDKERAIFKKELQELNINLQQLENLEKSRTAISTQITYIREQIKSYIADQISPLSNIICTLYLRAQGNRFIDSIEAKPNEHGILDWIVSLGENGEKLDNMLDLSQGQRQDLALAIFLARARSLGGTFFLDEPLAHLDDLNRVALLDTLRIIAAEERTQIPLRIVLTTASNQLVRHLREKFSLVRSADDRPIMKIYKLKGNPKLGLQLEDETVQSVQNLLTL